MEIGDIRAEVPSFWTTFGHGVGTPRQGEVIWIHPRRRFYRVRFTMPQTGWSWVESYYFDDRRGAEER